MVDVVIYFGVKHFTCRLDHQDELLFLFAFLAHEQQLGGLQNCGQRGAHLVSHRGRHPVQSLVLGLECAHTAAAALVTARITGRSKHHDVAVMAIVHAAHHRALEGGGWLSLFDISRRNQIALGVLKGSLGQVHHQGERLNFDMVLASGEIADRRVHVRNVCVTNVLECF